MDLVNPRGYVVTSYRLEEKGGQKLQGAQMEPGNTASKPKLNVKTKCYSWYYNKIGHQIR